MSVPATYAPFAKRVLRDAANAAQPSYIKLQDSDQELRDAIDKAVREYSRSRPLQQTKSLDGDNSTFEWVLDDEAGWSFATGFSKVLVVKFTDDDATERARLQLVPGVDYELEPTTDTPAKTTLRTITLTPATTTNVVVTYTRFHLVDDTTVSIPEQDLDAVIALCTSGVADQYAMRATSAVKAATGETSDLSGAAELYATLSDRKREAYNQHIFGNKEGTRDVGSHVHLLPESKQLGTRPQHHRFARRRPRA